MNGERGAGAVRPGDPLFYQAILDATPAHIAVLDERGEIVYVNAAWRRFAEENCSPDQLGRCLEGNYLQVLRAAKDQAEPGAAELIESFEQLSRGAVSSITYEYPCHSPEESRWFLVTASRIQGERGTGIAVVHVNITDRMMAQIAVREQEKRTSDAKEETMARLKSFATMLPDLVFAMTADGVFQDVLSDGDLMGERLAVPREHFLGRSVREIFPGKLGERFTMLIAMAARMGKAQSMRYQLAVPYPDGELRDYEVRAFCADGSTVYTVVRDTTELSQTIRALEASDERFRSFFESSRDGIVIADLEDRILDANPAMCTLLGYDREELLKLAIPDIQAPESRGDRGSTVREELELGRQFETVDIRKDGTRIDVEVLTGRLRGSSDQVICTVRDITARKAQDQERRFLSHAIEQSTASVVIANARGIIEYVNESTVRNTRYSREELIGKSPKILRSGWTSAEEYKALWATITSGQNWIGEFYNRRKDGTFYWEKAIISPIRDEAGQITYFVAVKDDITEQKRIELTLQESEERFRQLASHISQVFWLYDFRERRMLYVSPAFDKMHLVKPRDAVEAAAIWAESIHPEDKERILGMITSDTVPDGPMRYRVVRKADGALRWLEDNIYPVRDAAGAVVRLAGICEDVTEEVGRQAALVDRLRREASVGRIAAAVAHEVNNPLGTIKFLLRSMEKGPLEGEKGQELRILEEQVDRITTTVRALLGFSRQRGSRSGIFSAGDVLGSVIDLFRGGLDARGISFSTSFSDGLPTIQGDITAFQEIIINLLENAREILKSGDSVLLMAAVKGEMFEVEVRDSGPGLGSDPEHHFAPYVTARAGGTGLGLAIARRVCEASGGSLVGENGPDGGAVFRIRLPILGQDAGRSVTIRKTGLDEVD